MPRTRDEYQNLVRTGQWEGFRLQFEKEDKSLDYDAISELFDDVTPKMVEADYTDFVHAPSADSTRGKRDSAGTSPSKANLIQKAEACPTWLAFSEIIDNIFDNFRIFVTECIDEGIQPHDLQVTIQINNTDQPYDHEDEGFQPQACKITITENSGGIKPSSLDPFLSLGNSDWNAVTESVGVWGNGQKVAMARLGRYNRVATRHRHDEENGIYIQLGDRLKPSVDDNGHEDGGFFRQEEEEPRNYYSEHNTHWKVDYNYLDEKAQESNLNKTVTWLNKVPENTMNDLNSYEPDGYMIEYIFERLSAIFANKTRENQIKFANLIQESGNEYDIPKMSVRFNHEKISDVFDILDLDTADLGEDNEHLGDFDDLKKNFSYIEGSLQPSQGELVIPQSKILGAKDDLNISWLIGIVNKNAPPERRGFMCWGNGKLFEEEFKNLNRLKGAFPTWDSQRPEQCHWKGYLKFWSKDPSLIPWMAPTKWGWNMESKVRDILNPILSAIATPYWTCSSNITGKSLQELEEYYGLWEEGD